MWKYVLCVGAILALSVSIGKAADQCGGVSGKIAAPTGNIKNCGGTWTTPIGGVSNWAATGEKDSDWNGRCCVADTFTDPTGYKWVTTYLTNGNPLGKTKQLTAVDTPIGGAAVRLQLDDDGTVIDDGGFTTVASLNVNIVVPDKELSADAGAVVGGCNANFPGQPFGYNHLWTGTVSRLNCAIDFSQCAVTELNWNGFTANGCGLANPGVGNGTTWLPVGAGGTWANDHLASCHAANNGPPAGCTSVGSTNWYIKVGTNAANAPAAGTTQYFIPTYTFTVPVGGQWSNMTITRSSL